MSFGAVVFRGRWIVLLVWAAGVAALWSGVASVDPGRNEPPSLLPAGAPYLRAVAALEDSFPDSSGLSQAVVVFERRGGPLTAADRDAIEQVARRIPLPGTGQAGQGDLAGVKVRSPRSIPLPDNPLVSPRSERGQAGSIVVNVPANFVSLRAARVVRHIREILAAETLPAGLGAEVTGSCAYGSDYALAGERSHSRTVYVTLIAVVVILAVVYRAPLAALVPLGAVSLAAAAVLKILDAAQQFGMHVGTAEHIFVIVLLYGAGVDYSLMLISRHREFVASGLTGPQAAIQALDRIAPAVLASAATDIAGLLMLSFADFHVFRTAGPAVAVGLAMALLGSITLVPALLGVFGARVFWPRGAGIPVLPSPAPDACPIPASNPLPAQASRHKSLWAPIARAVTAHPGAVLLATLLVLALPLIQGLRVPWVYDTLTELRPDYGAVRGTEMAMRHWPIGQIAPTTVLVRTETPLRTERWNEVSQGLTESLRALDGVRDVRSASAPVGAAAPDRRGNGIQTLIEGLTFDARGRILRKLAEKEYVSRDRRAVRLVAILDHPPFTTRAMETVRTIRRAVAAEIEREGLQAELYLAGATAQMINVRDVTQKDIRRIVVLVLAVILGIVFLLLRNPLLSLFVVAATVLTYLATLGISYWVFAALFGAGGLDWKVEVFLFVVMVAVGVDYSIFLAARMREEARRLPLRDAVHEAIVHTGPVISSCGVIMAATLGSLMAGDLTLLHQLGFALALGILLDTFVTRPLLVPAFAVLIGRRSRLRRDVPPT
ncbi:MAG TPA: MMPL family transporter [Phycisphaerae bacterium]|nr:MMPL family transporter [Phycisphaerae bacterium]